MSKDVILRGMTWDHPRGYDPMVATAQAWAAANPGTQIVWEKRSLQAFADRPIGEMAKQYDLMVIDHPHVGEAAAGAICWRLIRWGGQVNWPRWRANRWGRRTGPT